LNSHSIAIIIPTYNRINYLEKLLKQVTGFQITGCTIDIFVIDDGSADNTESILSKNFQRVSIIKGNGNWWYTHCINEGLLIAGKKKPDYFLLLNDDIELDPAYLVTLLSDMESIGRPAILGSLSVTTEFPLRITFAGIKKIVWWRARHVKYKPFLAPYEQNKMSGILPSIVLPGRGMLISGEIINRIGLFEAKLAQYGSDDEFCLRAGKAGYPVFISWNSIVYSHYKITGKGTSFLGQTWKQFLSSFLDPHARNYWRNNLLIFSRYGNKPLLPLTLLILLMGDIKAFLRNKFAS